MNRDPDLRRNWRSGWLRCIQQFADDQTQRQMWLDAANTNPHFSYVECVCKYFDDCLLGRDYVWTLDEGLLTRKEVFAVAEFHALAEAYDSPTDDYDHETIVADTKWAKVVTAAKQAQAELVTLLIDPTERSLLLGDSSPL